MIKITKPLLWTATSLIFGLLQLWCILLWNVFDKDNILNVWEVLKDCGLLFFSTSIMVAIALDYFIKGIKSLNEVKFIALYLIPPVVVLMLSILIYCVVYFGNPEKELVIYSQSIILLFCSIYIIIVKYLEFNNIIRG